MNETGWTPLVTPPLADRHYNRRMIVVVVLAVGFVAAVIAGLANHSSSPTERLQTLTDAACQTLDEGHTTDFAYQVAMTMASTRRDVYGDPSTAAHAAVAIAQSHGCG